MKKHVSRLAMAALACVLVAFAVVLAGCAAAGGGTLSSEVNADTGAFKATASNADLDSAVGSTDAITLTKDDLLLVSPDLTKGKMQVTLTDKSDNTVFDKVVDGRVLDAYEVKEGTYNIMMTCKEAGTTGSVLAVSINAQEYAAQNESLDEAMAKIGANS